MVEKVESIVKTALGLAESERAVIIRRLIESLGSEGEAAEEAHAARVEQMWAEEIAKRVEQIDRGEVKTIAGKEVRSEIRKMMDERVD